MRERLEQALKTHTVTYADIRIEDETSTGVYMRGEDLDHVASTRSVGGIVRAFYRGAWGYATFNDLSNLEQRVRDASEAARLSNGSGGELAPVEPVVDCRRAELKKDFRQVSLAEKKALVEEYNQIAFHHHPKIQTTSTGYSDKYKKIWFASSEGTYIEEEQPDVHLFVAATARDGDLVQENFESTGGYHSYEEVEGFHQSAELAARRAVELLSAPSVTGGKYTVVVDPMLAGVFAHEAFGHLSESDFVYENDRMRELMVLGKRFGSDSLNILDDGSYADGLGTHPYDFEGVPTRKNYLIRDGILVGRLHSRETAAKMGEGLTGNARSVNYHFPPIVRMTNTYIQPGTVSFEDMIRDIPLGLYAVRMIGGQTSMEMFTFSAAYGYMIRDGQVAELVRDVTLTGNVFETLLNIDCIGNDLAWAPNGPGGCGKGGQAPLRVGFGGPHTRIQNVVVGGKQ